MDIHGHARSLLRLRSGRPSALGYFGARWIILKVVIVLMGLCLAVWGTLLLKGLGFLMLGYALGLVVADVRSLRVVGRTWSLAVQFYDWEKIESLAQNQTDAAQSPNAKR